MVDGVEFSTLSSTEYDGDTISAEETGKYEEWTCSLVIDDGNAGVDGCGRRGGRGCVGGGPGAPGGAAAPPVSLRASPTFRGQRLLLRGEPHDQLATWMLLTLAQLRSRRALRNRDSMREALGGVHARRGGGSQHAPAAHLFVNPAPLGCHRRLQLMIRSPPG